jgi:hypothetical protein
MAESRLVGEYWFSATMHGVNCRNLTYKERLGTTQHTERGGGGIQSKRAFIQASSVSRGAGACAPAASARRHHQGSPPRRPARCPQGPLPPHDGGRRAGRGRVSASGKQQRHDARAEGGLVGRRRRLLGSVRSSSRLAAAASSLPRAAATCSAVAASRSQSTPPPGLEQPGPSHWPTRFGRGCSGGTGGTRRRRRCRHEGGGVVWMHSQVRRKTLPEPSPGKEGGGACTETAG